MFDRPDSFADRPKPGLALTASVLLGGLLAASSTLSGCAVHPSVAAHIPTRTGSHAYCRTLDDLWATTVARKVARQHLAICHRKHPPSCDYKRGYEQAYVDVALGSDGRTPAVPPPLYWRSDMRTAEGHARAEQWFRGYYDGAQQAIALRAEFNRVDGPLAGCPDGCPP